MEKLGKVHFEVSCAPPAPKALTEGSAAVQRALTTGAKTQRERDYIAAIETFSKDADKADHRTRAVAYERAMERLYQRNPEDATEKHPVTPGPLVPARELLGGMLLEMGQPVQALREYEASHKVEPNRFHGLAGAGRPAELAGDAANKARTYYTQLVALAARADSERPEVQRARAFLGRN